ncbi:hypothetical protein predicted by Glimmer/Critica [Sorangium cellulosum So ce56]|uniref:Uncharacterized protein n=1 Tax=Sorangium cellulosum (strain So ce56) TaxID=448385 RepID=A9F187_SORC5|nr:hypothetical protein predicted by Glimmer/Critica [Sorangium cellulosum So ce56]
MNLCTLSPQNLPSHLENDDLIPCKRIRTGNDVSDTEMWNMIHKIAVSAARWWRGAVQCKANFLMERHSA